MTFFYVFFRSIAIWYSLQVTWKKTLRSQITYAACAITLIELIRTIGTKIKLYIVYKSFVLTHSLPNGTQ